VLNYFLLGTLCAFVVGFSLAICVAMGADGNGYWVAIQSWWRLQISHRQEFQQLTEVFTIVYPHVPPAERVVPMLTGALSVLALNAGSKLMLTN